MHYGTFYQPETALDTDYDAADRVERAHLSGKVLSLTLHDVAPATQADCERLLAALGCNGHVPVTLLVVPHYLHRPSTPGFERWIERRLSLGDELALHGWTHLDEAPPPRGWTDRARRRWYTAGHGEFAGLDAKAATERLEAGRYWFARRGWPLRGFVAPAWLLSAEAWAAVAAQPFDYTCTLTRLVRLRGVDRPARALHAWSIVFSTRAAWRRRCSLVWNGALARKQRSGSWMRFELHPTDVEHESVRGALARWLELACAEEREPLTLGALTDRLS